MNDNVEKTEAMKDIEKEKSMVPSDFGDWKANLYGSRRAGVDRP